MSEVATAGSAPSRALVVQQRRGTQMKRARLPRKDLERFGILDSTFGASGRNHWPPAHAEVSSRLEKRVRACPFDDQSGLPGFEEVSGESRT
jgi:hypothetical protein